MKYSYELVKLCLTYATHFGKQCHCAALVISTTKYFRLCMGALHVQPLILIYKSGIVAGFSGLFGFTKNMLLNVTEFS